MIVITLGLGMGAFVIADWLWPLQGVPVTANNETSTDASLVVGGKGTPLRAFSDPQGIWRYPIRVDQVSDDYLQALLGYEDRFYYYHFGINPASLSRAAWQWLRHGKVVSGGSTLTMQVARIFYPHARTISGKLYQMFRALQLEWHFSKQQILTLYINYAPYGGTIQGVQAASLQYLQKNASELRPAEAALLAILPQAPSRLRPDRHPKRAQQARDKLLDRLKKFNLWSLNKVNRAKQESVAVWPLFRPMQAPILAQRLKQQYPQRSVIQTYIDENLQYWLTDYVKSYAKAQGKEISTAVLVVENQSHRIKAYLGSADFLDTTRAGQVDMITALRSPGSTLKPLLYGLSLDDNLIHSQSLMADVPRVNSQYKPQNFSKGFSGPVSISEALQRSLNLPFVQLIEAYGEQKFANELAHVGQTLTLPSGVPNSAMILGGVGINLQKLVSLYSSLANKGKVYPLQFTRNEKKREGRSLMSEAAAWITYQTLLGVKPPTTQVGLSAELAPKIAWKTGTSFGNRDVWAIGVTANYTVGVWLGRPDGKPMADKLGATTAGPMLFSVFQRLVSSNENKVKHIEQPASVIETRICWPDGRDQKMVKQGCDKQQTAWTINGVTPRTLNVDGKDGFFNPEMHAVIDEISGMRLDRFCQPLQEKGMHTRLTESKSVYLWPAALESWLPQSLKQTSKLPPYSSKCLVQASVDQQLRIVGAEDGQWFKLPTSNTISNYDIAMDIRLEVEGATGTVEWYFNGNIIYSNDTYTKRGNKLQLKQLHLGKNQIIAVDKLGAIGKVNLFSK
ncbi:penicillin-binding protein 1C [Parashewanella spongiae]|uniref:penicillin-binding protein 1C n=1 Tax=Parashewanella spongiae TaxID=342950 RepID=UPI0011AE98CE|nr:penicillin-binding protein 1C [Parashewanella spongiae]